MGGQLYSFDFIDSNIGFAVVLNSNNESMIYKSIDGGIDWSYRSTGNIELQDIDQINEEIGFAFGSCSENQETYAIIFRTNDGWDIYDNWEKQYDKPDAYLSSIYMIDSLNGFVCRLLF